MTPVIHVPVARPHIPSGVGSAIVAIERSSSSEISCSLKCDTTGPPFVQLCRLGALTSLTCSSAPLGIRLPAITPSQWRRAQGGRGGAIIGSKLPRPKLDGQRRSSLQR
jgi:hypothetical protein